LTPEQRAAVRQKEVYKEPKRYTISDSSISFIKYLTVVAIATSALVGIYLVLPELAYGFVVGVLIMCL
jgi:hypothetical protein